MKPVVFAVPGDLATPTGGYAYDRRMIAELGDLGWQVDVLNLGEGFPWPSPATRETASNQLRAIPAGRPVVVDGLALGVLPDAAAQLALHHPLLALIHHPLAMESGLSTERAELLRATERTALATAQSVVVTSAETARLLAADYGVASERIAVARPGSDPVAPAPGSQDGIVRLLSVGAVVPRKGFDVLMAALATLTDLPWQLTIAGDRTRDDNAVARLDADIARHRLTDRVATPGAVSASHLAKLYAEADIFALASYFEGYGMAYAEAIAHGLPVVGTRGGAIPDTVPSDAGLLVAPGHVAELAEALRRVIGEADLRRRMASAARVAASQLPTWPHSAAIFARALERLA